MLLEVLVQNTLIFFKSVKVVVEDNDGPGTEGQFKNIHVRDGLRLM